MLINDQLLVCHIQLMKQPTCTKVVLYDVNNIVPLNYQPQKTVLIMFLYIVLSVIIIFLVARRHIKRRGTNHPPSPPGLPLIGNLHQIDASKLHLSLTKLSKKYGPLITIKLGPTPMLVISSAKVAKHALKDNDLSFSGRPRSTPTSRLSYDNRDIVTSTYSSFWRDMRKLVVLHLFTLKQVRSFRPVREAEVASMIEETSKRAESGEVIDLSESLISFASGLVCTIAFGKKYNDKRKFDKLLHEVQNIMMAIFLGDHFPFLRWVDKLSGKVSKLEKVFNDFDSFYQELIDEHLDAKRPESMNGDILDLLIKLRNEKDSALSIDWNHIKAILMNVFVAGSDTTAALITWAMTALVKSPCVLKRAQEEIRSLIGNKESVDEDDIEKLPYLKAIVKETFRLYPPVPLLIPKETIERCTIDGYEVQSNISVLVNVWAIGRVPEYWENPEELLPERFLNNNIDFKGHDFGLLPFGSGRRICPGLALGATTVELTLANLLHSFNWKFPTGMRAEDIDTQALPGFAAHKKDPLCLMAERYVN